MVFKLVRTDASEPCKIGLPPGSHLFGRGKFFDCDDMRVSRSHGELFVTDDTITLKALHQNPCFYIKKSMQETKILNRYCETELSHGDKFGLLPEAFWYKVIFCPILDIGIRTQESPAPQDQTQNYDANDPAEHAERTANKRNHSPDTTDDQKRPKLDAVKQEPEDVKPGPSNDQGGASNAGGTNNADDSTPPTPAAPVGRERCMYGANCYRRNPQHKAQFAHPSDPDWGAGPRGVCPWGTTTTHPPGVSPPSPNRPGMQVVQRNGYVFYIHAHIVNFNADRFQVEDSDGDTDDYEF